MREVILEIWYLFSFEASLKKEIKIRDFETNLHDERWWMIKIGISILAIFDHWMEFRVELG